MPTPATAEQLIRYDMGARLDFDPGASYAYSNFGFMLLGRVIEKVSGQKYEDFIRRSVLEPLGISRMQVGRTLRSQRAAGEVFYYEPPGSPLVRSIYPNVRGLVPFAYGGFALEVMDSEGAWIASPMDLLRFASMLEGSRGGVLAPQTLSLVFQRPPYPYFHDLPWWYFGLSVAPQNDGGFWFGHNGRTSADYSVLYRRSDGVAWALSLNGSSVLTVHSGLDEMAGLSTDLEVWLNEAASQVTVWPAHDLFDRYF